MALKFKLAFCDAHDFYSHTSDKSRSVSIRLNKVMTMSAKNQPCLSKLVGYSSISSVLKQMILFC